MSYTLIATNTPDTCTRLCAPPPPLATNKHYPHINQPTNQPTNQPASQPAKPSSPRTNQPTTNQATHKTNSQPTNKPSPIAHQGGGGFHDLGGWGDKAHHSLTPRSPTQHSSGRGGCTTNTTGTHRREEGRSNTPTCQCISTAQPLFKCTFKKNAPLQKGNRYPASP